MNPLVKAFACAIALSWPVVCQAQTARPAGKLNVGQDKPGNVFLSTEAVRIPIETQGDKVSWAVTDFWGNAAGQGSANVADQQAVIAPDIKRPGYFEVHLVAEKGGEKLAEADTTFVVTTPFDLGKVEDSPFGLMTHFAQNWDVEMMPIIARSGAKNIRDELYWGQVEQKKGEYAFREQFEKYMAAAKANNIEPLIVLSFANPNYDGGNTPHTPEGHAAYARYGQEVLRKYGKQIEAVEIWNEYNGSFAKGPATQDRPKYYTEMLKVAYAAIKQERPDVKVVGISAVSVPFPYFTQVFENGALPFMDAVSFHPYRTSGTPEGMERQINRLQDLIKKHNNGQPKPLWITDIGWYVKKAATPGDVAVTEADQAKYLVRAYALALASGVEKTYWYLFRDYDQFATMGIVRAPNDPKGRYAPKPAYAAFATLTRQLTGASFVTREETLNDVYSLVFRRGADEGRVIWSLAPVTLTVKANAPLTVVDMMGESKTLAPVGGEVKLALTDAPLYVWGAVTGLPLAEKQAGQIVADAEEEFSNVQGADGWHYGYFVAPAPGGPYALAEFKPFPTYRVTPWNYEWAADWKFLTITPGGQHPGVAEGKPVWAVRRWVSEVTGNVRLKGQVSRADQGDGTNARIFVDGTEVWTQLVGGDQPSKAKYDLVVLVKTGSLVDFAVDPGPGTSMDFDATSFSATITHLP